MMIKLRRQLTQEEKRKRAGIILLIYIVFFSILFLIAFFNQDKVKEKNIEANKTLERVKNPIYDRFNNFVKSNNYKYKFIISNNLVLSGEKNKETEFIYKQYNNKNYQYLIDNNVTYQYINNSYEKVDNINLYEEYDKTLLENDVIFKILKNAKIIKSEEKDNYFIEDFNIVLNKILEIYNDINKTSYKTDDKVKIRGTFKYSKDSIEINLKLQNFYKIVYNINTVLDYNLKYYDKDKVKINDEIK